MLSCKLNLILVDMNRRLVVRVWREREGRVVPMNGGEERRVLAMEGERSVAVGGGGQVLMRVEGVVEFGRGEVRIILIFFELSVLLLYLAGWELENIRAGFLCRLLLENGKVPR